MSLNDELLKTEITKIEELLYLKRLNIALLDTTKTMLTWVFDYCEKNSIPIWKEKNLITLITMTQNTLREISQESWTALKLTEYQKVADEKKHLNGTDKEVPVPFHALYKGGL
jgi:hypothetical protein